MKEFYDMKPQDRKNFYIIILCTNLNIWLKNLKQNQKKNKYSIKYEDNIEELKDKILTMNEISLYEKDNNNLEIKIEELRRNK